MNNVPHVLAKLQDFTTRTTRRIAAEAEKSQSEGALTALPSV